MQQLRKLKAKKAAPQIAELLKDPLVKEDAALALEDLGGPDEVQPLLDAVDTTVGAGSDTAARTANRANAKIAQALGNIGDPRAAPALLRLARASDDNGAAFGGGGARPDPLARRTQFPSCRTSSTTPPLRRC